MPCARSPSPAEWFQVETLIGTETNENSTDSFLTRDNPRDSVSSRSNPRSNLDEAGHDDALSAARNTLLRYLSLWRSIPTAYN